MQPPPPFEMQPADGTRTCHARLSTMPDATDDMDDVSMAVPVIIMIR